MYAEIITDGAQKKTIFYTPMHVIATLIRKTMKISFLRAKYDRVKSTRIWKVW